VHVVVLAVHLNEASFEVGAHLREDCPKLLYRISVEHTAPVLRNEDQMDVHHEHAMSAASHITQVIHSPIV
jgi:hypothetical protein